MNYLNKNKPSYWIGIVLRVIFLAFYLIVTVFPFYWMINTALKGTQAEIYAFPVIYWPEQPTFQNFINIAIKGNFLTLSLGSQHHRMKILRCFHFTFPDSFCQTADMLRRSTATAAEQSGSRINKGCSVRGKFFR